MAHARGGHDLQHAVEQARRCGLVQSGDAVAITAGSELTFWHLYDFENTYDGAVLEYSTNGGSTWTLLGAGTRMNSVAPILKPPAPFSRPQSVHSPSGAGAG